MAEEFLNRPQAGSAVQHMGGAGMPENMRGQILGHGGTGSVLINDVPDPPFREAIPPVIDEQWIIGGGKPVFPV